MSLVAELVFFGVLLYFVHIVVRWLFRKHRSLGTFERASIPGPKPSFWTGNSPAYITGYQDTLDQWCRQYGPRFGYYQGDKPVLVLADADDVNEVTIKLGKAFPNRQSPALTMEPFSSSLLEARGDVWRQSRRMLTPPFTPHKIAMKEVRSVINNAVARMLDEMDQCRVSSTNNQIHLMKFMKSVTLDVIARSAFSMEQTDVYEENSHLRKITSDIMEDGDNVVTVWATYLPFIANIVLILYESFGKYTMKVFNQVEQCIADYYRRREQKDINGNLEEEKSKVTILDFILHHKDQGNMNDMQVMGNAIAILLAGYDTTGTGLTFALYLLAKHQDIQSRLREEVLKKVATAADKDNYCLFDDDRCELLDRVWYESLRVYPPVVTFMTRELDDKLDQVVLSKTGLAITPNMTVQIPIWTIHHNAQYWPEPNRFDPFRENLPFPGATPGKQSNAFFAFGTGPRNCIGSNLALTEARAVITGILRKFRIELADEEDIDPKTGLLRVLCYSTVIIHPTKDIYIKLTPV